MSASTDATFARRLRTFRERARMTQQDLADQMVKTGNKFHRSTIGKIENGDQPVTIGQAVQLAGIIGIPLAELVTDAPLPVASPDWSALHAQRVADDARELHKSVLLLRKTASRAASLAELVATLADQAVSAGQDGQS